MPNSKGNTADRVRAIVEPIAKDLGLCVWDIRYLKEGASYFLRVFIDKEGGVSIDDCENLSRAIDKPIDEADPIKESYYLEVSSPGLERELTRPEHFEQMLGEQIKIKLIRQKDGKKEFEGVLKNYENKTVFIECNGETLEFLNSEISKVCLNDLKDI